MSYSVRAAPRADVFNPGTRTLSGTPTQIGSFTVTYTATDAASKSASLTFDIHINAVPGFSPARVANTVFAVGEFGEIALPRAILGNGAWAEHTRSWSPALPAWLAFDESAPAALKLSGTAPGSDKDAQTYTLTLTDSPIGGQTAGDSATLKVCFSVGDGAPCGVSFEGVTVPVPTRPTPRAGASSR